MFARLRRARSTLMGLAIIGIAFYHAPFIIHSQWLELLHSCLNCGVDMFLFLSGLGACHSIAGRGFWGYFRQRGRRLLPGLLVFLIPWSLVMWALGQMSGPELLGSVTLAGWWLGQSMQLNWYFSAVWMFFLLAGPVYALLRRSRLPGLLWLGLTAAGMVLGLYVGIYTPAWWLMTAVTRIPIFLTGMLFGVLEQRGFSHTGVLRAVCGLLMIPGLWLICYVNFGVGKYYGYGLGLWWYPYGLITPGMAIFISDLHGFLEKRKLLTSLTAPVRMCGRSSAEILMVHVGLYKLMMLWGPFRNRIWFLAAAGCLVLGCLYRQGTQRLEALVKKLRNRHKGD